MTESGGEPSQPSALTRSTLGDVLHWLQDEKLPHRQRLERSLRRLARWRQQILLNTYRAKHGSVVFSGPFEGMVYHQATEGATLPRLLGCYEAELHPFFEQLKTREYSTIVDIGCAEGYYAVGLARWLPGVQVLAHDIDAAARESCVALARENGVADRVSVGGEFAGETFASLPSSRALVVCDIEGAEFDLLDPQRYRGLERLDFLVEVHECFRPGLVQVIESRFAASHAIEWRWQSVQAPRNLPPWVSTLSHLDQILCTWEWRAGPTPWAILTARNVASGGP